jgi:hypothetical protein
VTKRQSTAKTTPAAPVSHRTSRRASWSGD